MTRRDAKAAPPAATASTARVHLALAAVQGMFASLSVLGKLALRKLTPTGLDAARMTVATSVCVAVWAASGRERVAPRDLDQIVVDALFGLVLNQLLHIEGLTRTTATNAVVMETSIPGFTVGVALALGREAVTRAKVLGLLLTLGGALGLTGAGCRVGGGRMPRWSRCTRRRQNRPGLTEIPWMRSPPRAPGRERWRPEGHWITDSTASARIRSTPCCSISPATTSPRGSRITTLTDRRVLPGASVFAMVVASVGLDSARLRATVTHSLVTALAD